MKIDNGKAVYGNLGGMTFRQHYACELLKGLCSVDASEALLNKKVKVAVRLADSLIEELNSTETE